jgi:ferritin
MEYKMTISKKMNDAINKQINKEFFSGYLYLSAAIYLETHNLDGMAHWMKLQAKEEFGHGMKFYGYVIERGGLVSLSSIDAPKSDWKSPLEIFEYAYEHEKKVTEMINSLVDTAKSENDVASQELLNWFVKEQVEEEANSGKIAAKLKLVGDNAGGLFIIDGELGRRQ